jgi:hypothetical protein
MEDFRALVATEDTWTMNGTFKFLMNNSMLKQLQAVARFDNLNRNTIVTVADTGALKTFVYNDGKVARSKSKINFKSLKSPRK